MTELNTPLREESVLENCAWLHNISRFGDRVAFVDDDIAYSYQELVETSLIKLDWLCEQGVGPGEVVILNDDFGFQSICLLLALAVNRNVIVPLVNITETALESLRESCDLQHVVSTCDGGSIRHLRTPGGTHNDREAHRFHTFSKRNRAGLILLSSGSTGKPKLILHDLDTLLDSKVSRRPPKKLKTLLFLLFDHIGGINTMLNVLFSGGTAVNPDQRTPEGVARTIEKHRVSILPTSPTFLNLLLMNDAWTAYDLSSVRLITYGTETMPVFVLEKVNAAFPRAKILQTFGTSETGISKTVSRSSHSTDFKFSDDQMQYKIVDGELYLKSTTQFVGYLNHDNKDVDAHGWFKTGDMVEQLDDGFIRVVGRAKEVINVGGEKVLPLELESILMACPGIEDCVVYAKENAITGQAVCVDAKVSNQVTRNELRSHIHTYLEGKVERFKFPSRVNIVSEVGISARFKKVRINRQ